MRNALTVVFALFPLLVSCGDDVVVGPTNDPPSRISLVSGQNQVGIVGTRSAEPVTVRVVTAAGAPVENVTVLFRVQGSPLRAGEGGASVESELVATDANGVSQTFFTFGTLAGALTIAASAADLQGSPVLFNAMGVPADATLLQLVAGDQQTGTVGQPLADPIQVRVTDMFANGVPDVTVDFAIDSGGGSVDPASVTSSTEGLASTEWTLGTAVGAQGLRVTADGVVGFPVFLGAQAVADAPETVTKVSGDVQGGAAGEPLPEPLVVEVRDQYANAVEGATVSFTLTMGDGSLSETGVLTDVNGLAGTGLTLGSRGDHEVTATVGALPPVTFTARALDPVVLDPPSATIGSVDLAWSQNPNAGFSSYELYRATGPGVDTSSTPLATVTTESETSFSDDTAVLGTTYYYRILVRYDDGFSLWTNEVSVEAGVITDLLANGFDLEYDAIRDRIYVSVTTRNEVAVLSATDLEVLARIVVGTRPQGIALSSDGQRLYCALNQAGSVAALDLTTTNVESILIGNELGDARTYDVLEPLQDVLLVTSNPSSSGFAYVVRVDIDFVGGHTASRVAGNRIIRARPVLERSSDGLSVYVGEGFSPNSLYKLDMAQVTAPIVLEDDHGSVSGTDRIESSPDDSRIYLRSGQILQSSTFEQVGAFPASGVPRVSGDGTRCYLGRSSSIEVYDTTTQLQIDDIPVPYAVDRMILLESANVIVVLAGDRVVGVGI